MHVIEVANCPSAQNNASRCRAWAIKARGVEGVAAGGGAIKARVKSQLKRGQWGVTIFYSLKRNVRWASEEHFGRVREARYHGKKKLALAVNCGRTGKKADREWR